jgi:two-component system nitrate/nitrite response regulator NarL
MTNNDNAITRILIVDDHIVFRESLAQALTSMGTFEVEVCGGSHEAVDLLNRRNFDLLLLDFDLGGETGLNILRLIPGIRVVVAILTAGVTISTARELLSFDVVRGLLIKDTSLANLVESIEALAENHRLVDSRYASALISNSELTGREQEIMRGLVGGLSNKEIASTLFTSESTVKNTLQGLFRKFNVRTRSQLVRIALEEKKM